MKKTVFISSTYVDLKEHRKSIWELLKNYDVVIKGMEDFGARKETPLETCLNEVSCSDIYIGIIAQRLGSVEKNSGKSFTQLEYQKALKEDKEILIYLIDKNANVQINHISFDEDKKKLDNFKTILKDKHTVDTFKDKESLTRRLSTRLDEILSVKNQDESLDSFEYSRQIIEKFHILPKSFSEMDMVLKIKITGEAFPASKELCDKFGYSYARTIGVPIEITEPQIKGCKIKELFLNEEDSTFYFDSTPEEEYKINGKLLFTASTVDNITANFFDAETEVYTENPHFDHSRPSYDAYDNSHIYMPISAAHNPRYIRSTKTIKGEGRGILVLNEVIAN